MPAAKKPAAKAPSRPAAKAPAKKSAPPWTQKSDDKADRKAGIRENSAKDKKLDAKRGLKK